MADQYLRARGAVEGMSLDELAAISKGALARLLEAAVYLAGVQPADATLAVLEEEDRKRLQAAAQAGMERRSAPRPTEDLSTLLPPELRQPNSQPPGWRQQRDDPVRADTQKRVLHKIAEKARERRESGVPIDASSARSMDPAEFQEWATSLGVDHRDLLKFSPEQFELWFDTYSTGAHVQQVHGGKMSDLVRLPCRCTLVDGEVMFNLIPGCIGIGEHRQRVTECAEAEIAGDNGLVTGEQTGDEVPMEQLVRTLAEQVPMEELVRTLAEQVPPAVIGRGRRAVVMWMIDELVGVAAGGTRSDRGPEADEQLRELRELRERLNRELAMAAPEKYARMVYQRQHLAWGSRHQYFEEHASEIAQRVAERVLPNGRTL